MTAAPVLDAPAPAAPSAPPTPGAYEGLLAHAARLFAAGAVNDGERVLREAMTIAPERPEAYRSLALHLAKSARDIDAFAACATMLSRAATPDGETLLLGAEILLFLHLRHQTLVTRQTEPVRLDFRAIGVDDVAPMVLAPEFLRRAHALAKAAVKARPHDPIAWTTLAECELHLGNPRAARKAGERAVACEPLPGALFVRAIAIYEDKREDAAIAHLRSPRVTECAPSLAMGQVIPARVTPAAANDPARTPWCIPYRVRAGSVTHLRTVTVHTGAAEARTIAGGRVVGGHFFPLDQQDRAEIHGIVDEPDVQFSIPRLHDFPALLGRNSNTVLRDTRDHRLLLHSPAVERHRGGRAFLLATNFSANYYHWIVDALGRLSAMPEVLTDPDIRFVVPTPLQPFQVETLAWLGISLDRVVQVADDEIAGFDELIVVRHRKDGGCSDAGVVRWLRDRMIIPDLTPTTPPARRLFLTRGSVRMRRLLNEHDAEAHCLALGFESVDTSAMSVAAQRDLFSQAAVVVSPVGASLTNLLFTPSGARTVLFGQRGYIVPCYNALADALGHSVCYVLGTEQASSFVYPHWDYTIAMDEFAAALHETLA